MCDAIVAALEHDDEEGNRRQPHLEEDVMCSARTALELTRAHQLQLWPSTAGRRTDRSKKQSGRNETDTTMTR